MKGHPDAKQNIKSGRISVWIEIDGNDEFYLVNGEEPRKHIDSETALKVIQDGGVEVFFV